MYLSFLYVCCSMWTCRNTRFDLQCTMACVAHEHLFLCLFDSCCVHHKLQNSPTFVIHRLLQQAVHMLFLVDAHSKQIFAKRNQGSNICHWCISSRLARKMATTTEGISSNILLRIPFDSPPTNRSGHQRGLQFPLPAQRARERHWFMTRQGPNWENVSLRKITRS